ncbi:SGNH/GDSL hydrolase family protein [Edaphobacter aggregans]|uniref:SGNH/GDSL hydrolase family protein n=1 Tax=Edaphobacter aggregans TaxID=570835 RepID=UPI00146FFDC3|nr:SGNH/GDSL hydrolase family protein [Edaphobacter aggregans]
MNLGSVFLALTAALAFGAVGPCLTGCSNGSSNPLAAVQEAQAKNVGNFSKTVFLGDSLTAGYQSGSLLDTQQGHGWAPLVAAQAQFSISLPLIAYPGAPNVLKLTSLGPPPVITTVTGTTTGRDDFATQPTDLAVPGAFVNDVINTVALVNPAPGQQQINQLVLGYPGMGYGQVLSQLGFAVQAQPTTIFLWTGNNDALVADLTGTPATMTSTADFTSQYTALIQQLSTQTPAHLVIGNVPDVTLVPYLQPAAAVLAQYSAVTHIPVATLSTMFGITAGDYVTPAGLTQISAILAGAQKTPISDPGVLTAAEAATAKQQVAAYNQVIAAQAKSVGATLVDINALFNQVAANGVTINGVTGTTAFLGGIFSLDGIHPTNTGYAVIANYFIDAMNAGFSTKIPDLALGPVAAADPLWPLNLSKTVAGRAVTAPEMPAAVLEQANALFVPETKQ